MLLPCIRTNIASYRVSFVVHLIWLKRTVEERLKDTLHTRINTIFFASRWCGILLSRECNHEVEGTVDSDRGTNSSSRPPADAQVVLKNRDINVTLLSTTWASAVLYLLTSTFVLFDSLNSNPSVQMNEFPMSPRGRQFKLNWKWWTHQSTVHPRLIILHHRFTEEANEFQVDNLTKLNFE